MGTGMMKAEDRETEGLQSQLPTCGVAVEGQSWLKDGF